MADNEHSTAPDHDQAEVLRTIRRAAAEATPAELAEALQQLLGLGSGPLDLFGEDPPPSQRRPRRSDVVTYRVRVDLVGAKPPLWRRLELASDLFLDDVHQAVQAAFGWTDTHLHRFGSGPPTDRDTEYYLCPFDAEEGSIGIPEQEVRLDEVLVDVGDRLYYEYDYGDDWRHTIKVEAVLDRDANAPRAVCTAGRRPDPPEDCGGVYGYELLVAASDPTHPDHAGATAEIADIYGDDVDWDLRTPTPFDIDETNAALAARGLGDHQPPGSMAGLNALGTGDTEPAEGLPEPLAELVDAVRTSDVEGRLRRLIASAGLDEPVQVDADTAARMVHPYAWLLRHVGEDGIKLTSAGYLPPVHVGAAFEELSLADEWIGKGNREDLTLPVLHLRETAQRAGLLRKHRGRLVVTARGREVLDKPVALWWQLAERMPPRSSAAHETQAGTVLLLAIAADITDSHEVDHTIAEVLNAIGWRSGDGMPLTPMAAARSAWDTWAVLRRLGAFADADKLGRRAEPTDHGVTFARAALRTW